MGEMLNLWRVGSHDHWIRNDEEKAHCPLYQEQPGEGGALHRSSDFQVCCIAGFQTRGPAPVSTPSSSRRPADLEIGDTVGLETCVTGSVAPAFFLYWMPQERRQPVCSAPIHESAAIGFLDFFGERGPGQAPGSQGETPDDQPPLRV